MKIQIRKMLIKISRKWLTTYENRTDQKTTSEGWVLRYSVSSLFRYSHLEGDNREETENFCLLSVIMHLPHSHNIASNIHTSNKKAACYCIWTESSKMFFPFRHALKVHTRLSRDFWSELELICTYCVCEPRRFWRDSAVNMRCNWLTTIFLLT